MTEPTTAAGKALLDGMRRGALGKHRLSKRIGPAALRDAILAIEREAVAAFLASDEAVERLAKGLHDWGAGRTFTHNCTNPLAHDHHLLASNLLAALIANRKEKKNDVQTTPED